jgi:hypothetical protein
VGKVDGAEGRYWRLASKQGDVRVCVCAWVWQAAETVRRGASNEGAHFSGGRRGG